MVEQEKGRTLFEAGPQRDGRTDFYVTPNLLPVWRARLRAGERGTMGLSDRVKAGVSP